MREDLRNAVKGTAWAKFISVMMILGGIVSILGCITIPLGIVQIMAAMKLLRTAEEMNRYKNTADDRYLYGVLENLSGFFTLYGWTTLIGIILAVIILFLYAILIFMGVFDSLDNL
ncbi:MAG: DUF5362 family protein [candidate division WOR-3 bacterium]